MERSADVAAPSPATPSECPPMQRTGVPAATTLVLFTLVCLLLLSIAL